MSKICNIENCTANNLCKPHSIEYIRNMDKRLKENRERNPKKSQDLSYEKWGGGITQIMTPSLLFCGGACKQ